MPSKYSTFKNRTSINQDNAVERTSEFIENSVSSVNATRDLTNTSIRAVIIPERKEGADETILFTYASDNVAVGEYITYDNVTYLVYSEYKIMFSDAFKKHKIIECNIELRWGENSQKAYYISSLRSYSSLADDGANYISYEFSTQKPIIITKMNPEINFNTRFLIMGDAFVVNEIDKISNQGIYYLSVEKGTKLHDVDNIVDNTSEEVPEATREILAGDIIAGEETTIETNFGYAVFSHDVNVISKTSTQVVFEAPIGVSSLSVKTKDINGTIVITNYRVVV